MNQSSALSCTDELICAERWLACRRLPEALDCFGRAQKQGADQERCSAGLWTTHMLLGAFEAAWCESDALRRRDAPDVHRFWRGESIKGRRVMLRCLHGLGDTVQLLRYASRLQAAASALMVQVPPRLFRLAQFFHGVDQVTTWGAQAVNGEPAWDVQVEIMELPYLFRTKLTDLPVAEKYFDLPAGEAARVGDRMLNVGLVWTAGDWNAGRSLPLHMLEPLLAMQPCVFWNLQATSADHSERSDELDRMRIDEACRSSVEGLAATIARLDLVITVDTLAAHLAGALSIPAWVMLPYEADWRWMHDRADSPWYPSLRLFRQQVAGEWPPVIAAVRHALADLIQASPTMVCAA